MVTSLVINLFVFPKFVLPRWFTPNADAHFPSSGFAFSGCSGQLDVSNNAYLNRTCRANHPDLLDVMLDGLLVAPLDVLLDIMLNAMLGVLLNIHLDVLNVRPDVLLMSKLCRRCQASRLAGCLAGCSTGYLRTSGNSEQDVPKKPAIGDEHHAIVTV